MYVPRICVNNHVSKHALQHFCFVTFRCGFLCSPFLNEVHFVVVEVVVAVVLVVVAVVAVAIAAVV